MEEKQQAFSVHEETSSKIQDMTHEDFFDWLACAVVLDDSSWEEFPGFYREVICRKLVRIGKLELHGECYALPDPKRCKYS